MSNNGWLIGWERFRSTKIHKDDVIRGLEKYGFPTDVVHDLTPKAAFARAAAQMKENRQIDKLKHSNGTFQFQLTSRTLQDERLEFDFETIIELDGGSGRITCANQAIQLQAELLFQDALAHRTPQDITKMVQKLLTTQAEMWPFLVEKGCVYFIPSVYSDTLDRMEKFVTDMGGTFRRSPVPKGDEYGDRTAKEACMAYLSGMLKELREVVDGFDETTRSSTMLNVAKSFQELAFKAQSYKEYTNFTIETAIEEAKQALLAKVKAVEAAKQDEAQKLAQAS